jgi:hypothetical protein
MVALALVRTLKRLYPEQWFPSRTRVNTFSIIICYSSASVVMRMVRPSSL